MYFDHIYCIPPKPQSYLHFPTHPTKSSLCCLCPCKCGTSQWSMVDLAGATVSNKKDSPFLRSHLLSIAPHWGLQLMAVARILPYMNTGKQPQLL